MNKLGRVIIAAVFAGALAHLKGSSDDGGGPSTGTGSGTGTGTGTGTGGGAVTSPPPTLGSGCATQGTDVMCVTLSSGTSSLPADNASTTILTATLTRNGSALAGVILNFSLGTPTMGSLTATSGVTSAAGTTTTTFQSGGTIGAVGISVTHPTSNASSTLALSLTQAAGNTPAGIQFVTATPAVLGVVGSGQPTTSNITFRVTDSNGSAVSGQLVNFTLVGPTGAYIGTQDGTPLTATGTTSSTGNVIVPLNAGNVAGPVTISAAVTVAGSTFTTSTSVISIGGAVPSATHFSLATQRFNLPGLVRAGFTTTLSVFLADRFSNFNILSGTQVSFFTEAGAVDTSVNLDETGAGSVTFRTQTPMPLQTMPAGHPFPFNGRGWLNVIAVTRGEEGFADINGNGVYDAGVDTFNATMDLSEPFVDTNENGVWDGPGCTQTGCDPTHAGELFVDANANGRFDGPNGVWDGPGCAQAGCIQSPMIWRSILLQFTGHINVTGSCDISPTTFNIANGGFQTFTVTLHDGNLNAPVPGTTISVSSNGGSIQNGSGTVMDGIGGPFRHTFTLLDADSSATSTAISVTLTISVTTPSGESIVTCTPFQASGTVN
jgi:hypothetical protein